MLAALALAPVLVGAGMIVPPLFPQQTTLVTWAPSLPAVAVVILASGAHDLRFAPRIDPDDARLWAGLGVVLALLAALVTVAYAALRIYRPGTLEILAAPRIPLILLAGWALTERLHRLGKHRRGQTEDTVWEDAASLALLLGLPLALLQVVPGLPTGRELMGPLARPITLLLLAGVVLGWARLGQLALGAARLGDVRDL